MRAAERNAARVDMAREMPFGWCWGVTSDAYGVVCAAWRSGREWPESVHLEARSAGDLADEIALYQDSLQAAFEIARGGPGDDLDERYGGAA